MATRKLVEISPENYRGLQAIRREAIKDKRPIPSMPFLVNQALENGMDELKNFYTLYSPPRDTQNKVSSKRSAGGR